MLLYNGKKPTPKPPSRVINMENVSNRREYIHPERPGSTYMKDDSNFWFIKNSSTDGQYLSLWDPYHSRSHKLDKEAQIPSTKLRTDVPASYGKPFFGEPEKPERYIRDYPKSKPVSDAKPAPKPAPKAEPKAEPKANSEIFTDDFLLRQQFKESSFNPKTVSPAGAAGLAQIMPDVKGDAVKAGIIKSTDSLYDPEVSAKIQKWYMTDLYNASFINKPNQSNEIRLAKTLAAYNHGRGNFLEYLNRQKEKGVDIYSGKEWMNELPTETKDYVNKILYKSNPEFERQYAKAVKTYKFQTGGTLAGLKYKLLNTQPQKEVKKVNLINPMATKMYPSKHNWNPSYYGWQHEERLQNPDNYIKMGGAGASLGKGFNVDGFTQTQKTSGIRNFEEIGEDGEKVEISYPYTENINFIQGTLSKNLPKGLGAVGIRAGFDNYRESIPNASGAASFVSYESKKPKLGLSYNVNKGFPIKNGYVNFSGSVDKAKDYNRIGGSVNAEKYFSPKLSANVGARVDKDNYNKNWNINAGLKYRF